MNLSVALNVEPLQLSGITGPLLAHIFRSHRTASLRAAARSSSLPSFTTIITAGDNDNVARAMAIIMMIVVVVVLLLLLLLVLILLLLEPA